MVEQVVRLFLMKQQEGMQMMADNGLSAIICRSVVKYERIRTSGSVAQAWQTGPCLATDRHGVTGVNPVGLYVAAHILIQFGEAFI